MDALAPSRPWAAMELPALFPLLTWGWHVWADGWVKGGERRDAQVGSWPPKDSLPTPAWLCSAQPFPMGRSSRQPGRRAEPPRGANTAASCAEMPPDERPMVKSCRRPRYRTITHGSFILHVAMSSLSLHLTPWSRRHLDLGKGMSTWSSQGEGRPCTWSLLDEGFPQAPLGQCYYFAKADKKSTRVAQWLHRGLKILPWGNHVKGGKHCMGLAAAKSSWFFSFLISHRCKAVLPPLPVGTGVRITSTLI